MFFEEQLKHGGETINKLKFVMMNWLETGFLKQLMKLSNKINYKSKHSLSKSESDVVLISFFFNFLKTFFLSL